MGVDTWTIAALVLLIATLCTTGLRRRRAARRLEEERARLRARRRRVPVVSANLRGLPPGETDLWAEEASLPPERERGG